MNRDAGGRALLSIPRRVSRPRVTLLACVVVLAALVAGCAGGGSGGQTRSLVYDSWGGLNQQQETKALIGPYQQRTGVSVGIRADADNMYSRLETQVRTGRGDVDVAHLDASWLPEGTAAHLFAPIDYSVVDKSNLLPGVARKYGVRYLYWSWNIVYNSAVFGDHPPTSWADVWAYARRHPHKVALWESQPDYVLEIALMASGVPAGQVYPWTKAKLDAAYRSLDKIRDDVVWFSGGTDGDRMFSSGQVDVGMLYGGDTQVLKAQGAKLGLSWNQAVYTSDYLAVPVNAPNKAAAMRFINAILQAKPQADMAALSGYGFVNRAAQALIKRPAVLRELPSYGPNVARELPFDDTWWGQHESAQVSRWNAWLRG